MAASVSHRATSVDHARPSASSAQRPVHKSSHHRSKTTHKARPKGQQAIDNGRARQIQEALVREHYLGGQPSGIWDGPTQEAMRRYQQAQGWQSKTVPDSRALIRLGLGPDQQHLLNPESAMTTAPEVSPAAKTQTAADAAKLPAPLPSSAASSSSPLVSPSATTPSLTPQH